MALHQIAEIRIVIEQVGRNHIIDKLDFKAEHWYKSGTAYIKDDEISKFTLKKIDERTFMLTVEQLDLFGIELGRWDESQHPERENLIKEALSDIRVGLQCEIKIMEYKREVK
jgi:hypothetical protein